MITKKQFAAEFAELAYEAGIRELCAIDFTPEVRISPRSYADVDPANLHFRFAPEVLELPRDHRRGLMMHEIGHVLCPEGSERDADRAAEKVFGVAIEYDCAWPGKGLQRARNPARYKVAYLDRGWREYVDVVFVTLKAAISQVRTLKRNGFTAWIEKEDGTFVPIKGTMRRPRFHDS